MDILIVALLVILIIIFLAYFLWERSKHDKKWKEQSERLSKTVGESIADTTRVFGEVREKLGELSKGTQQIEEVGRSISSLQEILRAPKPRGGFGELMLERLLAEILPTGNFDLQYRFNNGEIVDAIIRLGENIVPIDSKFPLEDFERILAAETEEEQTALRKQFTRTIKKHIDNITKYILPDEHTFDFALMYIPAENVYYETIIRGKEGNDIYYYSTRKRVIPVSPNSFYAYLQVIVQGLKGLRIQKAAREIQGHLDRLKGNLDTFEGDFDTLGSHIKHASTKYDEAYRKLTRVGEKLRSISEANITELPEKTETTLEEE